MLPIPDDGRVEAAAVVVLDFLKKQPNIEHPSHRMAVSLARLILRSDWLRDPNGKDLSQEIRWCHRCGKQTPTRYAKCAMRCQTCGFATVAIERPRLELTSPNGNGQAIRRAENSAAEIRRRLPAS